MELPGRRELREQILHQMDGRTSYVSDADVYREIDNTFGEGRAKKADVFLHPGF